MENERRTQPALRLAISMISLLVALGFCMAGSTILFAPGAPTLIRWFGAAIGLYGIAVVAVLFLAWRSPSRKWPRLAAALSAALVAIWIAGSFDRGVLSRLEISASVVIAVAATLNWYSVRLVGERAA